MFYYCVVLGHEEDMDTGATDQVLFDMDQGYTQSYTQDQVDEMNQQLNQTRKLTRTLFVWILL